MSKNQFAADRNRLGSRLFTIAVSLSKRADHPTKTGIRDLVRPLHRGVAKSGPRAGMTLADKVEAVLDLCHRLTVAREKARRLRDRVRGSGVDRLTLDIGWRLADRRRRMVGIAARNRWRDYQRQSATEVHPVATFEECIAQTITTEGWIEYADRGRSGIVDAYHVAHVYKWAAMPEALRHADGLVTLGIEPTATPGVYRACWVRQGRGSIEAVYGWIALDVESGTTYHAEASALVASRGLRRKLDALGLSPQERDAAAQARADQRAAKVRDQIDALGRLFDAGDVGELADVVVTLRDSYRAGHCEPGTLRMRDLLFSDEREFTTLGDIVANVANLRIPEPLAGDEDGAALVAACLRAIRRQRRAGTLG